MTRRGQSRRLVLAGCICLVLLLLLFRQDPDFNHTTTLQLSTSSARNPKADVDEDSTGAVARRHPSVFQQWREHPPPAHHPSVHDCSMLHGMHVQAMCRQQLSHVIHFCSARQERRVGSASRGSDDNGTSPGRTESSGVNDGTGIGDARGFQKSGGQWEKDVVNVFSYRHGNTVALFCSVHKVASTFWIRLFRFLHRDPISAPMSRPEAISKYNVHLTPFNQSRPLALAYITRRLRPGDEQFRFMFTRDPYSRLWAVFIDKFVLPDFFFWSQHVSAIKDERYQKTHPQQKRRVFDICSDVSFEEFVQYAVGKRSFPSSHSDSHILPISKTCSPCSFGPNFIGRLENMAEASQAVLERLNLTFLTKQQTFQEHILSQIRTTSEFVYEMVIARGNLRHCVSDEELVERLLRAFVFSGYLPRDVMMEKRPRSVVRSVSRLVKMMQTLFLAHNTTAVQMQKQRKMFFIKAYKSLPRSLLLKVRNYYKEDFDSFGYDPEPPELFSDHMTE